VWFLCAIHTAWAEDCDPAFRAFDVDCLIQYKYKELKKRFAQKNINIDFINEYRSLRLIARKDYKPTQLKSGEEAYLPWKAYKPSPKTWVFWEKGNYFREQLNHDLDRRGDFSLTVEDLKQLHRKVIDKELVGAAQEKLYRVPGFTGLFPPPGDLRKGMNINSGFKGVFTEAEKEAIDHYDLADEEGRPYVTGSFTKRRDGTYAGSLTYLDSSRVEVELAKLVDEINVKMNKYLKGEPTQESPIDFIARMQRKYVSIHPFHESNGRMSRLIQDLLAKKLDLPFVPGGDLQNDVTTTTPQYRQETKKQLLAMLNRLQDCLIQVERTSTELNLGPIASQCDQIYTGITSPRFVGSPEEHINLLARKKSKVLRMLKSAISKDLIDHGNPYCKPLSIDDSIHHITQWSDEFAKVTDEDGSSSSGIDLDKDAKRRFIERLATPLTEDLVTYSWVEGQKEALSRMTLYTNSYFFRNKVLGDEAEPSELTVYGNGLYVSKNPFDSSMFGIRTKERAELLPAFVAHHIGDTKDSKFSGLEEIITTGESASSDGKLLKVTIKKGQRVLNITDPKIEKALAKANIELHDVYTLNPNIVIDYSMPSTVFDREDQWMNIKLRNNNAFEVRMASPDEFTEAQIFQISHQLMENQILGGTQMFRDIVRRYRKQWEEQELAQFVAKLKNPNATFRTPFGDCLIKHFKKYLPVEGQFLDGKVCKKLPI
jgi:hypothetical protein